MILNYLKIAFRNIRRNFIYSFINIAGLAVGLASAIVIGLWVHQEWSYDRHFKDADRIYRVGVGFMSIGDMAPGPELFTLSARAFPEVQRATSIDPMRRVAIRVGEERFEETAAFRADSAFFRVFSYD
ncbi:MAG: ABC transporter permease, partial [Balneolaceae bacterium]|nr:ABC transporter permease [Balneolaceae bacterium]